MMVGAEGFDGLANGPDAAKGEWGDGLRIGCTKIVVDRVTGSIRPSREELNALVDRVHRSGGQVAIHAVEEETADAACDAIQLALAPVFLLTGIAGLLNIMTGRLARIIDRGRKLIEQPLPEHILSPTQLQRELHILEYRRKVASHAITACTLSALLVCLVVTTLFVQGLMSWNLQWLVGMLFIGSTLTLVVGLGLYLREVQLATQTVRILPLIAPAAPASACGSRAAGHAARRPARPVRRRSAVPAGRPPAHSWWRCCSAG